MSEESSGDLARTRELVLRHGWNATAYQILNPRIAHWFHPLVDAVVGYVEAPGRLVAAGDPVAPREALGVVARSFEDQALRTGRKVCWFAASEELARVHRMQGASTAVPIGEQPVWQPAGWAQKIRHHRSLRAQLHRARNKGVVVSEWPAARATHHRDLEQCLGQWLATRPFPTMHFLVEPETLGRVLDRRVFVAEAGGTPVAFLVASPVPMRRGWLIEQIIRSARTPNGSAELLVDHAIGCFASEGYEHATLGLAPLARHAHGGPAPALWLEGVLRWLRAHGERFYHFRGIDFFKSKFQPDAWEPVFAVSNERAFSVRTLYAIGWAFSGGTPFRSMTLAFARAFRQEIAWLGAPRASHPRLEPLGLLTPRAASPRR